MQVNKFRDLLERVSWTFIQAYIGLGAIDWLSNGLNATFINQVYAALGAALAATIKVLLAQRVGSRGSGDAIPGGIEENPSA